MGGGPYQRPQIHCYYCKEAEHTVMLCQNLVADLYKKISFKQRPNYYYPNQEPIRTYAGESIQDLFRKYSEKTRPQEERQKPIPWNGVRKSWNSPTAPPPNQGAN
ncbi:hypothetical protein VP01_4247g2 [Puccinia sorghi]|uniref:Uncharacterized protein n=1 Tax=Puccinia sorghi TaxID=27349 RepID=A0A0L6UQF9_9BASI|nr:hypothetical protein VP01_4247g2 [Puccinia sorghi]